MLYLREKIKHILKLLEKKERKRSWTVVWITKAVISSRK